MRERTADVTLQKLNGSVPVSFYKESVFRLRRTPVSSEMPDRADQKT